MAELKDNINTMIGNLRLTTAALMSRWLKTNWPDSRTCCKDSVTLRRWAGAALRARSARHAQLGVIYQVDGEANECLRLLAAYADDGATGHITF